MTPELQARLRKELDAEREHLITELRNHGADPDSEKVDAIPGIDEGFADSAQATTERSENLALIESTRERLTEVDAALASMDEGTYGTCSDCGDPIPEARLEARPLSVTCVSCAAKVH